MNRRNFLRNSSLAGITLSATGINAFGNNNKDQNTTTKNNFTDDFILNEITINELQKKMQSGEMTSVSITNLYLKRINDIDKNGPKLNAIIELNPDAISIAAALDKERKAGKIRGPLHGIPMLVKDNINTGDKMMTTAGALALEGNIVSKDAFIIKRLREAGAVLLGKTNLASGQISDHPDQQVAGAAAADKQNVLTYSIATHPDQALALVLQQQQIYVHSPSEQKRMVQLFRHLRLMVWLA